MRLWLCIPRQGNPFGGLFLVEYQYCRKKEVHRRTVVAAHRERAAHKFTDGVTQAHLY